MNSVFSAFKTGKSSIDNTNIENKSQSNEIGTNSVNNKMLSTRDSTSYEKLRHIREITMSNNFIASDDAAAKTTNTLKSPVIVVLPSVQSSSSLCDQLSVDISIENFDENTLEDTVDSATVTTSDFLTTSPQVIPYSAALPPSGKQTSMNNYEPNSELNLLTCVNSATKTNTAASSDSGSSDSEHNCINKIKARSEQPIDGSSNNSKLNNKIRLSLSCASGVACNNSIPLVHGRSKNGTSLNGGLAPTRTRLSTHQRNLSLDFRSMGILLPPVSQVTNTRINVTQHHRNRSLDSALQRIPEVEVSSPSAESENTLCTNILLGPAMCAKTIGSEKGAKANQSIDNKDDKGNFNDVITNEFISTSSSLSQPATDNITLKDCDAIKKREDLTSLGSDDSGIICGSEGDRQSLNRIRISRESLDSGEVDPSEEECIHILETASIDEECRTSNQSSSRASSPSEDTVAKNPSPMENAGNRSGSSKNDVIFRNLFGATKNAIVRTAQSIRDNHDKKKNDQEIAKNPIEKKREFSIFRPINKKHVQQTSNSPTNDSMLGQINY